MDEHIHFYTALRRRMLDSLSTTLAHEHWVVMQGVTGSGKSTLARGAITHWPNRALTMSPTNSKGYQWEWTVIADTEVSGNLTGRAFSSNSLWRELLCATDAMPDHPLLLVLEDSHRVPKGIVAIVEMFIALMPQAHLLITGNFSNRQQRQLRINHPVWFQLSGVRVDDYRQVFAFYAGIEPGEGRAFPDKFIRDMMKRSQGNLHLAARAGRRYHGSAPSGDGAHDTLPLSQQADTLRCLPAPRRGGRLWLALFLVAIVSGSAGGYFAQPLSRGFPSPARWITATKSPVKPPALTSGILSARGSLALLYSVWGYEVDQGEAWCDQAFRAGMACVSGTDTLASLMAQGLPWIAALEIENTHIPVVIIGGGGDSLVALSGEKTWVLNKAWFSSVWKGSYTLMWKPSPDGNGSISKKSSADDIVWLDTMLSRVLNVDAEETGEWSPVLIEKIRQFQRQNKIKADGVMGRISLIRLWQALGESPKITSDGGKA
ncbi:peptidoglycan-binding domain-containing protein [Enterobacter sp. RHBSTW-00175]|uniref:peptidoglycan-binding domain-containing protein n=1 Tax=Enterobacter sp. RHBSTW-00175 TaxID=2742639 RepID=UPI0015EAF904|nr:peptidoglycan-binding domain-containing protein [Enterobacter sp. RHBSTW-00175]QMR75514.1 peptidoglycan-binding protein [Enterobacter sp. RHBSTW-00175]